MGTVVQVVIALAVAYLILRLGVGALRMLGTPLPPPPPPGEMRRVKLQYRCPVCGMELRIERATEELPEPPRHCQEEMELVAPIDE